jgi:translation initiation factor IF-3
MKKIYYFKNEQIKSQTLFVIDEKGRALGEMSKDEALKRAKEDGKDLVLINFKANPPLAKIIEFGKFLYQIKKKTKRQKQKELKEIRISFNISDHDWETKKNQLLKFLNKGHRVRLTLVLEGRENLFKKEAGDKLNKFAESIDARIEAPLKSQGNTLFIQFLPKK